MHGLALSLPFPCDQFEPLAPSACPDVVLREGEVPAVLAGASLCDADFDFSPTRFLFRGGERAARFLIEDGTTITLERGAACEMPLLIHHLVHSVMAALLRQRQLLVFHASTAVLDGRAVMIGGDSGAGKSTSIARLTRLGWTMQADDVSAVRLTDAGGLEVLPGTSHIHLDDHAAESLALDTAGLVRHDWHRMKMAYPAPPAATPRAVPLVRIAHLTRVDGAPFSAERVIGRAKLPMLLGMLYGPMLPEQIAAGSALIDRMLATVEMIAITRPAEGWTMDAVIDTIRA